MLTSIKSFIDYFIPDESGKESSNLMMLRTFVFLHLAGPAMGHAVILFLYQASTHLTWVFWVLEVNVAFFWLMPFIVRRTGNLQTAAAISVQALVFLSLFGSFFYGGISSPFLPWLLIALLIGFFYLADRTRAVLIGVMVQLILFLSARLVLGDFPELLPLQSLKTINLVSIIIALAYVTAMSLYYENVMRASAELEQAAREQRENAEALRVAMERAETASRQKSIFLAKMSHELRTPLNAVIGYSEMLREDLGEKPSSAQKAEDLDRINAAGRHLLALVTDVLDLSNIESNEMHAQTETVSLKALIDEVVDTATPLFTKKDNRFVLQLAVDLGAVRTDPLKLRQSLLNLLSNAAKFTSKGTITLTALRRRSAQGDRIMIEVRDTGIGISSDGLKRLFQDFSQAEAETSRDYGGTGLGLALTRRFCTLMGGSVQVESQLGSGSSFMIDLPADADSARLRGDDLEAAA